MLITSSRSRRPRVMMAGESCANTAMRFRAGRRKGVRVDWMVERRLVAERMYGCR